jgi:hypothetical protein
MSAESEEGDDVAGAGEFKGQKAAMPSSGPSPRDFYMWD